ncbi:hypothetical protein AAVH_36749, partial [Aphelenchoides avenae]
ITVPKTGFLPEEPIEVTVQITNNSPRPIVRMEVSIVEKTRFIAFWYNNRPLYDIDDPCLDGNVKDMTKVVASLSERFHLASGSTGEYKRRIQMPAMAMMVAYCPIVRVTFCVKVTWVRFE